MLNIFEISPITEDDEETIGNDVAFFHHLLKFLQMLPRSVLHPELVEFEEDVQSLGGGIEKSS